MRYSYTALVPVVAVALAFAPMTMGCGTSSAGCEGDCCGDTILDPGEECDDGNLVDGDGCSANCTVESCDDVVCTGAGNGDSFCAADLAVDCADDGSGCLVATTVDCTQNNQACDDMGGPAQCVDIDCDDPECVGAIDGDSFCAADLAVDCDDDGTGCLVATTVDCTQSSQVCDDTSTGAIATCVTPSCDDPECAGATDGDSLCLGDVTVDCAEDVNGCLLATTLDCATNSETCDAGSGTAVCVCVGCQTWGSMGCSADAQCDTGVCWDFADYDPLCGGSTCSIECNNNTDCQQAFTAAGADSPGSATCGPDGRCDPLGTGFGAFFCQ